MVTPIKEDTQLVTINIDGTEYEVPAGGNLVDIMKWYAGNDVPVFCHHPKMEPVGMCRMCNVEIGFQGRSRATGEMEFNEDGTPLIRYRMMTACTETTRDGMYVRTENDAVKAAREHVLEFLLTSHPLDCPICDKGGECPLQNLTLEHGPGTSRMYFDDKMHLDKHYPLGDLIFLDRERCIQCARCVRFQDEIVGDDVLAFHERGRRLQIITNSDPGFDTYFSGNTTDICPVGALTTGDFRFGARPWELTEVPSISPWDAAGENISLSTRLDRDFGGRAMVKRVMPRQNEHVNEIWISDKTRFGHHFTRSDARLMEPTINGEQVKWEDAFARVADILQHADGDVAAIAGGMATNEDLWELRQLLAGLGSEKLGAWPATHAGADLIDAVGMSHNANLGNLGKGDAILVIASDLEEEVPLWRLRLKQAQDRGAYLVIANARHTRMEDFALDTWSENNRQVEGDALRYDAGQAAQTMVTLRDNFGEIADKLANAENLVIVAGAEGLTLDGSRALMQAAANFLIETGHAGKANSGLMSTIPGANGMGLYYMGYTPEAAQDIVANPPKVLVTLQADEVTIDGVETVISLSLFPDEGAHINLPVQSFAERDGTYINGERRVQRFYTAQGPLGNAIPAWKIIGGVRQAAGQGRAKVSAAAVMLDITKNIELFAGMRYKELARVERQFPDVGGDDKYYGGTAYQNKGGLGIQIPNAVDRGEDVSAGEVNIPAAIEVADDAMLIIPSTRLYDRSVAFSQTELVNPRVAQPFALLNTDDANKLGVVHGDMIEITVGANRVAVQAHVSDNVSGGAVVLPRNLSEVPTPMVPTVGQVAKLTDPVATEV